MNVSYWEQNTYFDKVDVVIIGSGIVGLNAALYLKRKEKKLKILVLERGMLPMGASSKNAGFACFGSISELMDDLTTHSEDEVFNLVNNRWKGLLRLRKNLGDTAIDFQNLGGYEIFDSLASYQKSADKLDFINQKMTEITGSKGVFRNADTKIKSFGFKGVKHMILNKLESQIDTGKMISMLINKTRSSGIEIINGFEVKELKDEGKAVNIISENGINIKSKKVIVATNGFAKQLLTEYDVKPARAQVLVTESIRNLKIKGTFHYDGGYYYFRNVGNRVLLGGGRNLDFKTEETMEFGLTDLVQDKLESLLQTMILPGIDYKIGMRWSGIMGMGKQKKTIIKAVSDNVFCGVRLGGMGVAIGSLVGEEVAKMASESI